MNQPGQEPFNESDPLKIYGKIPNITRIFYWFTFLILISFIGGILILLSHGDKLPAALLGGTVPVILLSIFLIRRQKFEATAIFLALVLFFMITVLATIGLGIHSLTAIGYPSILIVASLVIRKRTMLFLTVISIACVAWLVFGELSGAYTPTVLVQSVPGDFFTVSILLIATAIMTRQLSETVIKSNWNMQRELLERKRVEERLAYDTLHDALTNLPNRTLFMDRLGQRIEHAKRHPENLFAVLFIDLDRFKVVNDSLGHAVGDKLLIATAQRLRRCIRPDDTVSRLSGDEFAVLLNDFNDNSDAIRVAERIQAQLTAGSMLEAVDRASSASIGIAIYNGSYTLPEELLRDADSAMYRAKAMGGGRYQIFDDTMYASAVALLEMEADLKRAVERCEWLVYYQPIVSLSDSAIIGAEALLRWNHPRKGIILPQDFIIVAEETGLIVPIGEFVLNHACAQVKAWRDQGFSNLWGSVNLSGRQFVEKNLVVKIYDLLAKYDLPGNALQIEVTESVAMKDINYSIKTLEELDRLGIQVSLDDFGNGYSSLGYLNSFPLKVMKIDRSFVKDILNKKSQAIISAMISMGHTLNMEVVGEGVETAEQLAFLQAGGCDHAQGFLFGKPVPAEEFARLLELPIHI